MVTQNANAPDSVECAPVYHIRDTQGMGAQAGNSSKGSKSTMNSTGMSTSLPSRHRDSSTAIPCHHPANQGDRHLFPQAFTNTGANAGSTGSTNALDIDMDFPSEFGLGDRNPPSDHPTPSTLNSSSNTSYSISGLDNQSPGQNQQKFTAASKQGPGVGFDKAQSVHISPTTSGSPQIPEMGAMGAQSFSTNTTSPLAPGSGNAFNVSSGWDMGTPNADIHNVDFSGVNMDTGNMDTLTDAQWVQLLNNASNTSGWSDWRQS